VNRSGAIKMQYCVEAFRFRPMRSSTTENHISRLKKQVDSLCENAKWSRPTLQEMHREVQAFYDKNAETLHRLPEWAQEKVSTYLMENRTQLTRRLTRQFYLMPDGRKIPSWCAWESMTEDEKNVFRNGGKCGRLVTLWMSETIEHQADGSVQITLTPTDRVYFESQN
jgi:hypothetical protein